MELLLNRRDNEGDACAADLYVDHVAFCYTLEDVVRVDGVKVYAQTAVPHGRFQITLENSPHFGDDTITLHLIPNFQYVRMHGGNKPADTKGCILVGDKLVKSANGPRIANGTSQPALKRLKAAIAAAIARGEQVWITIVNPHDHTGATPYPEPVVAA